MTERTLSTKKLISQSYLGNETEEDAILPILPLIRESMVRSHARAMENAILAGNHADGAFGTGGAAFEGLITMAGSNKTQLYDHAVTLCHSHHLRLHGIYGKRPTLITAKKQQRWVEKQRDKYGMV